jgi:hypothetical protein
MPVPANAADRLPVRIGIDTPRPNRDPKSVPYRGGSVTGMPDAGLDAHLTEVQARLGGRPVLARHGLVALHV